MQQPHSGNGAAPGLTDLFRLLADDASALVRGEVALAKLEMREAARGLVRDSSKLAIAFALAWFGGIALTAAAVIGVAHLLGGRFGSAALIVGVVFLAIGGVLARSGMRAFSSGELKPEATLASLDRTTSWAKRELREMKQELTSGETAAIEAATTHAGQERTLRP
ncbi:MAG: phage holin family protein [Candidatus Cloacimonetes bacterium]|nr:phage holin family protein [Candidatus Cloacimonadota bacterium]